MPSSHATSRTNGAAEAPLGYDRPKPNRDLGAPFQLGVPYWFHLFFPGRPFTTDLSIFIAGCEERLIGSVSRANPRARVVAFDERPRTLFDRGANAGGHSFENLHLIEGSLEGDLNIAERFDLVYCSDTGLWPHRLPDVLPRLTELLRPDGAMHLSITARRVSEGAQLIAELLQRLGVDADADGYKQARAMLAQLSPEHPWNLITPDAREKPDELVARWLRAPVTGCSVAEACALIENANLRPQRFTHQAYYLPQCSPLASTPLCAEICRLPREQQQALMELYWPWLEDHCVVACRRDGTTESREVDFSSDAWLDYSAVLPPELRLERTESRIHGEAHLTWITKQLPPIGFSLGGSQFRLLQTLDRAERLGDALAEAGLPGDAQESLAWGREFFERMWDFDFLHFRIPAGPGRGTPAIFVHDRDAPEEDSAQSSSKQPETSPTKRESCPLCSSSSLVPLRESPVHAGGGRKPRTLGSSRWMRCDACDHHFSEQSSTDPPASERWTRQAALAFLPHLMSKRPHAAQVLHTIATLRESASGTWLDYGCGTSGLAAVAEEFGYEATGVDWRQPVVRQLADLGYRITRSTLWELDGCFDVVSISDGLDQSPLPAELLRRASGLLRPRGLLFVAVPARDCLSWRALEKTGTNPYWRTPPYQHHFTRKNLFSMLHSSGLEPCHSAAGEFRPAEMQVIACAV